MNEKVEFFVQLCYSKYTLNPLLKLVNIADLLSNSYRTVPQILPREKNGKFYHFFRPGICLSGRSFSEIAILRFTSEMAIFYLHPDFAHITETVARDISKIKIGGFSVEVYGYIRVSSKEQNIDRQVLALREFPVQDQKMFIDKLSGKDFQRPAYQKMINTLKTKDLVVVKSIDRLGRNYNEILEQWRILTKVIAADIVVLDMPLLDTRAKGNDLTGTFIADLVLQILSYVAQTERESIRRRQMEGIAAAKYRGVKFGRPSKPVPDNFHEVKSLWTQGFISSREGARRLQVSQDTFLRWSRRLDLQE